MKITGSKFQDFYEFDCYKYGEPSILPEWYRSTYIVDEADKDDDRSIQIEIDSPLDKLLQSLFLYDDYSKYNWRGKYQSNRANLTPITIDEQIIGIYPFLYYIPVVGVREKTGKKIYLNWQYIDETILKPFNAEDAIALLKEPDYYKENLIFYQIDYQQCIYPEQIIKAGQNLQPKWKKEKYRNINDPFIIECREIFNLFNEPIIRFDKSLWTRYRFRHGKNGNFYKFYADLNINLSKTPILKYYPTIQTERDIYTEIENWVISIEREPEHISDNKTKIISHGFDLKTSFRKM